jgi:hypothetical protein
LDCVNGIVGSVPEGRSPVHPQAFAAVRHFVVAGFCNSGPSARGGRDAVPVSAVARSIRSERHAGFPGRVSSPGREALPPASLQQLGMCGPAALARHCNPGRSREDHRARSPRRCHSIAAGRQRKSEAQHPTRGDQPSLPDGRRSSRIGRTRCRTRCNRSRMNSNRGRANDNRSRTNDSRGRVESKPLRFEGPAASWCSR